MLGRDAAPGSGVDDPRDLFRRLDAVAAAPVLNVECIDQPVKITSMDLLRNGKNFLRARTDDRRRGRNRRTQLHAHDSYISDLRQPRRAILWRQGRSTTRTAPLGTLSARRQLQVSRARLWVCVAAAEFAILDLLGRIAGKSVGRLLGGVRQREIAVYRASGSRGNTPEEEVDYLKMIVADSGAKALKFRLGGRMSKNADSLPGRTEKLIPLVRAAFGKEMTLYADSNSSYDVPNATRIGRLMEEHDYAFYEEPCEFDRLEDTKAVADALRIPIAGGEQEFSEYRFRWAIAHRAVDIVQPDLHYYGGFIRSLRVGGWRTRRVCSARRTCRVPGSAILTPRTSPHVSRTPFRSRSTKEARRFPVSSATSTLKVENGRVQVPTGPGLGVTIDPSFVRKAIKVTT